MNGVSKEQYGHYTHRKIDFEEYVSNIRDLYEHKGGCEIYVKAIKDNLSETEQEQFFELFGNYADRIFLERIAEPWPNFSSEFIPQSVSWGNYDQPGEEKMVCPYIFYTMVINSDGTVSSCIGDWSHSQIVGDCNQESLKNIWRGRLQYRMQMDHLKGSRNTYPMCRNCGVITYGCYDNIDGYAERILQKMESKQPE